MIQYQGQVKDFENWYEEQIQAKVLFEQEHPEALKSTPSPLGVEEVLPIFTPEYPEVYLFPLTSFLISSLFFSPLLFFFSFLPSFLLISFSF